MKFCDKLLVYMRFFRTKVQGHRAKHIMNMSMKLYISSCTVEPYGISQMHFLEGLKFDCLSVFYEELRL